MKTLHVSSSVFTVPFGYLIDYALSWQVCIHTHTLVDLYP